MDNIISNSYLMASSANEIYGRYRERWEYLLESYMGGEDYRRGGYLTKYSLETGVEYDARLEATPLDNHCKSTIAVYVSFLFRESPKRELYSLGNDLAVEDFLKDADYEGRNFNAFMKEVATWSSVFGHCYVMVTKPNINAQTRADELAAGVRPYLSIITPLVVTDWSWNRAANGKYVLDLFKYVEDINGSFTTIKEWTPETIRTYVVDEDEETVIEDTIEPNGLGMIPVVICYSQRSPVRGIGVSDINDIADHQRKIYNELSEVEQSIRLNGHPALCKTPSVEAVGGAGAIVSMPDDMDPALKPYLLDVSTDIGQIYQSIEASISAIEKMANIGAVRSTEARRMSGVAQEQEFQLLNARLSEKADNLENCEEGIWRLYAMYQGIPFDAEIEYPDNFNIRDTQMEIQQLATAAGAATSPQLLQVIDNEILKWLDVEEDEMPDVEQFQPHIMISPEGEQREVNSQQEHLDLMAQGWTHE